MLLKSMLILSLCLYGSYTWSNSPEQNTEPSPATVTTTNETPIATKPIILSPAQKEIAFSQQLAKTKTTGELLWWKAEQDYLVLYHTEISGKPRGALIILPNRADHPLQPNYIQTLQNNLPQHGWATIASMLPNYDDYVTQRNPPVSVDSSQGTSSEPPSEFSETSGLTDKGVFELQRQYWQQYNQRLESIWENSLQLNNKKLILLAHGLTAGLLIDWLHQHPEKRPSGVILISPYHYDPLRDQKLANYLAEFKFPILELIAANDLPQVKAQYKQHLAVSQKKRKRNFRQIVIEGADHRYTYNNDRIVKLIRGWLQR